MTAVSIRVAADAENCMDTSDGGFPGFITTGENVGIGNVGAFTGRAYMTGFKFSGVNSPSGATWSDGTISMTFTGAGTGEVSGEVRIEDSATPAEFTNGDGPPDRTDVGSAVAWDTNPNAEVVVSPDLATPLNALVTSVGAITDLAAWFYSLGDAEFNKTLQIFEDEPTESPLFEGNYTAGADPDELLASRRALSRP
jgi:hypothetical protein